MAALPSLTEQLQRFAVTRDREIAEAILREVMPRLHAIASRELGRERKIVPVSPTELINEVWATNLHKGQWKIDDREHFFAIAAKAMRMVLVDMARKRLAERRGSGAIPVSLDVVIEAGEPRTISPEKLVEIGRLMDELEKIDPQAARVIEMKDFAGFTYNEIANITGLSFKQVRRRWERGNAWLRERLSD